MKLLMGALFLAAATPFFAQDPATPAAAARPAVRAATDVIIAGTVKKNPFTADESGETVKILPDGNRIVHSWTGKMARNSKGFIYRNILSGKPGDGRPMIFGGGLAPLAPTVVALGPADGAHHVSIAKIDAETAASRAVVAGSGEGTGITVVTTGAAEDAKAVVLAKVEAAEGVRLGANAEGLRVALSKQAEDGKFQTRKESLGTRDFGGVSAEGVRVTTTYLPGAIGNEREIEITSETWFSKELGVVVYSKRTDPRSGETTYQLTNINRVEPDPSLFPGNK